MLFNYVGDRLDGAVDVALDDQRQPADRAGLNELREVPELEAALPDAELLLAIQATELPPLMKGALMRRQLDLSYNFV